MDPTSKTNPLPPSPTSLLKTPKQGPKTKGNGLLQSRSSSKKVAEALVQAKAMTKSINICPSLPEKHPQKLNQKHPNNHKPMPATAMAKVQSSKNKEDEEGEKKKDGKAVEQEEEDDEKRLVLVDGGGFRRRSFCGSDLDLGAFLSGAGAKVLAKDMPPLMVIHAVSSAKKNYDGLEKFSSRALAFSLKKEFDGVYGPAWHCIVGFSFGSFVTHTVGGFIYFSLKKSHILLFKTAVQRAE